MAQQKERKQPILVDGKNIFTHGFQSIKRLQPKSKTYAIRNFKHTKHKGDNPKLRIFSFIPLQRRMQLNFINHPYHTTKQTNATQTIKTTSTWVSPPTQSLCCYNWDDANSGVFRFTFQMISKNSYSTNFVHFVLPYMNPLPIGGECFNGASTKFNVSVCYLWK